MNLPTHLIYQLRFVYIIYSRTDYRIVLRLFTAVEKKIRMDAGFSLKNYKKSRNVSLLGKHMIINISYGNPLEILI